MKILNMAMVAALLLGQAAYGSVITYTAVLLGTSEVPPTGSLGTGQATVDRKSTRLNSSHRCISYAVFFLQKIPFGQPILVGHYSERHARADQDSIHSN